MVWHTMWATIKPVIYRPIKLHPDTRATSSLQLAKEHLPADIRDILE